MVQPRPREPEDVIPDGDAVNRIYGEGEGEDEDEGEGEGDEDEDEDEDGGGGDEDEDEDEDEGEGGGEGVSFFTLPVFFGQIFKHCHHLSGIVEVSP
ncbi:MAG: hypothetical protein WC455_23985 [Dehalococcoidia bacterium]|jgi:hypothetical protein